MEINASIMQIYASMLCYDGGNCTGYGPLTLFCLQASMVMNVSIM